MALNSYQKMCYKWFGRVAENAVTEKLELDLERAHIDLRADAYLSYAWMNTILAFVVSAIVYVSLIVFLQPSLWVILLLIIIPVFTTIVVYFYYLSI